MNRFNPIRPNGPPPLGSTALVLILTLLSALAASGRPTLSLDGAWSFRFAPDDRGDGEQWFQPGMRFEREIQVPGCWQAQGIGRETAQFRHQSVGVGWYRRSVEIPKDWVGRRVRLHVGAAHRSARIWLNGRLVGQYWGYSLDHCADLTPFLREGTNQELVIAVDSRSHPEHDPAGGAMSGTGWGGLYEHVSLDCTGKEWIDDAFVQPEPLQGTALVELALGLANGAKPEATAVAYAVHRWSRQGPQGPALDEGEATLASGREPTVWRLRLAKAPLWSPDTPNLLLLRLTLKQGPTALDETTVRFGQRRLEIRGPDFYLNGQRFLFRGYGEGMWHPLELIPPADASWWANYFSRRKEFGFNGVRQHSSLYPESCLAGADEAGFLIQPELQNGDEPRYTVTPVDKTFWPKEFSGYIKQMRNHPSVFSWCMGNELYEGNPMREELYPLAKRLDPTRPVIDSDGVWPYDDRPTLDYHSILFDEMILPWGRYRNKFMFASAPPKPVIAHEMTNLPVLQDLNDIPKYKGELKPAWLFATRELVKKQGLEQIYPAMVTASQRLQASLIKLTLEAARLSPFIDGYHQWFFRDAGPFANGVVNPFDEARALPPEQARLFNADLAVLWDHQRVSFRSGELIDLRLFLSDFRPAGAPDLRQIQASLGGESITLEQSLITLPAGQRGLMGPWTGQLRAPLATRPQKFMLEARAGEARNQWPVWVFPAMPESMESHGDRVIVSPWLTRPVLERLAEGAAVLVTNEKGVFPTLYAQFKSPWFLEDDITCGHAYGNLFMDHPALRGFPCEGYGDLQAYNLLDERPVVMMDQLPVRIEPILWCLDSQLAVPWKPKDVPLVMRRKAYLWEARVGQGRLLVSTMNLSKQTRTSDIAAGWLYHRLREYIESPDFQPKAELPLAWLRERVNQYGLPEAAHLVEGFRQITARPAAGAEMARSHRDAPSGGIFRTIGLEAMGLSYGVRQDARTQGDKLRWQTAPVPKDWPHETISFIWAGSFGDKPPYDRQAHFSITMYGIWTDAMGCDPNPGPGRFWLDVNGQTRLEIPFTKVSSQWSGPQGSPQLRFIQYRRLELEHTGVFILTLPVKGLAPGRPVELTLTATPGPNPWRQLRMFAYDDLIPWERDGH